MAKKKKTGDQPTEQDRHSPHRMVRVPLDVHELLRKLADRHDRSISRELRRIIVEELKRQGLWPSKGVEIPPPEEAAGQ